MSINTADCKNSHEAGNLWCGKNDTEQLALLFCIFNNISFDLFDYTIFKEGAQLAAVASVPVY